MDYTLKGVDDKLWQRVKIMAVTQQKSIKQIIIELLKEEVKKFKNG